LKSLSIQYFCNNFINIEKNHKIFNYRQRDFLSQRHGMKLDKIR